MVSALALGVEHGYPTAGVRPQDQVYGNSGQRRLGRLLRQW